MPPTRRKLSAGKKVLIIVGLLLILLVVGFRIFMARYLPPLIRQRLSALIVEGSKGLYRYELGKIDPSFWGTSLRFTDLNIYIDSLKYKELQENQKLPPLTFSLHLPKGTINDVGLPALILRKKLNIDLINFAEASIQLSRHFQTTRKDTASANEEPLWKLISPDLRSISVNRMIFQNIKIQYSNVDSARAFAWQFEKSDCILTDIRIDSASATDMNRLLYASNVALAIRDVKLKTTDGLYAIGAGSIFYTSSGRSINVKQFAFNQLVDNNAFIRHFGYQHEIYRLAIPEIKVTNFSLPSWISYNQLVMDTIHLESPDIGVYMDRNAPPNPYSKMGKFPQQLLQKAPFVIKIKRIIITNGDVTYREKNDQTQLTGKLEFPACTGYIDNITNDSASIAASPQCVVNAHGGILKPGNLHAIFRINLADPNGSFSLSTSITNLNASHMQALVKATSSMEMQSFNMHRLDYTLTANQYSGTGQLKMKYGDMDVLMNKVKDDGSLDKKGLLSFLVNHLVIYKENPMNDGEERIATDVKLQRVATKSFFNFIWKTLFTAAGKIILRPVAQRKIEKKKEKAKNKKEKMDTSKK